MYFIVVATQACPRMSTRLQLRLRGPVGFDNDAMTELRQWAEDVDQADDEEMKHLAMTLAALSTSTVRSWWSRDRREFTRVFNAFSERLGGSFKYEECNPLADFAERAVNAIKDSAILRDAVRGLAELGENNDRWHVRDVVLRILQAIRREENAVAAVEGLRTAGRSATEWTVPSEARRTLPQRVRAGLAAFLGDLN